MCVLVEHIEFPFSTLRTSHESKQFPAIKRTLNLRWPFADEYSCRLVKMPTYWHWPMHSMYPLCRWAVSGTWTIIHQQVAVATNDNCTMINRQFRCKCVCSLTSRYFWLSAPIFLLRSMSVSTRYQRIIFKHFSSLPKINDFDLILNFYFSWIKSLDRIWMDLLNDMLKLIGEITINFYSNSITIHKQNTFSTDIHDFTELLAEHNGGYAVRRMCEHWRDSRQESNF